MNFTNINLVLANILLAFSLPGYANQGVQPLTIHAMSETWNWLNLGLVVVAVGGLSLVLVAAAAVLVYVQFKPRKTKHPRPATLSAKRTTAGFQPALRRLPSSPSTKVKPLRRSQQKPPLSLPVALEVRKYLEQVNGQMLKNRGIISEAPGEIRLIWPDAKQSSARHTIRVKVLDAQTLEINQELCFATPEGVKTALVSCLRTMNMG